MRDLEEELVPVHPLVGPFLQRQQALGVQVALVVRGRCSRENWL